MPLKIYAHPVSQPSRAVLWTCMLKGLPFEFIEVDIMAGASHTPEFKALNPSGQVPTIDDDGFVLYESNAILTYLAEKNGWTDLYPTDVQQRALVNRYLHWHHSNSRVASTGVFRPTLMAVLRGIPGDATPGKETIARVLTILDATLAKTQFIVGDSLTLADIAAYCEFDQLEVLKLFDFTPFPHVVAWMERMKQVPKHDEAHEGLNRFAAFAAKKLGQL